MANPAIWPTWFILPGLLAGEPRMAYGRKGVLPGGLDRYTDLLAEAAEDIAELRAALAA